MGYLFGCPSKKTTIFVVCKYAKKNNPSGVVSIQVIDKSSGAYQVIKTIGSSSDTKEIDTLYRQGKKWIDGHLGIRDIFEETAKQHEEQHVIEYLLSKVENILLNGTQLILNQVFELIGFNSIDDDILKHLVTARISQPSSKAGTVEYLKSYFDEDVELHNIYRYLDKLHNTQQEKIHQISVEHTRKILGGRIGLVFYDVITLYFETDESDESREKGFQKTANTPKRIEAHVCICFVAYNGSSPKKTPNMLNINKKSEILYAMYNFVV